MLFKQRQGAQWRIQTANRAAATPFFLRTSGPKCYEMSKTVQLLGAPPPDHILERRWGLIT